MYRVRVESGDDAARHVDAVLRDPCQPVKELGKNSYGFGGR